MNMVLGIDHRANDGAQAAAFLRDDQGVARGDRPRDARLLGDRTVARELPMFSPPASAVHGHAPGAALDRDSVADRWPRRRPTARPPSAAIPTGSGEDAVRRELPRPQGPAPRPEPQHRLRGGPLPEHRRVLGPAHGHDHDPRRHLHPRLRLLRREDRPPDLVRRRRAAPRRRGGRRAAAWSTSSSRASPATTCPTAASRIFAETIRAMRDDAARAWASRS